MACLSDPAKRRQYDQVGSEDAYQEREQRTGGGGGHSHGNFGDFVSGEDLFNHFFFGQNMPRTRQDGQQARR
jgi:DnaJ-class molecular chaperone